MPKKRLRSGRTVGTEKLSQMADALSFQVREALACQFGSLHNLSAGDADSAASIISENAHHILRANMDFAEYCRIISGTEQDFPKKIEVCREMRELCKAMEFFAVRLKKTFGTRIPKSFLYVDADPEKFRSTVLNLVLNAFKYSGNGASIDIRLSATRKYAKISVRDNGPGMPPEVLARAFEPFFSWHPDMIHPDSMGLGLTLGRHFAKSAGGSLVLNSEPGRGTEAVLSLPLDKGESGVVTSCASADELMTDLFSPVFVVMSDLVPPEKSLGR
ncbi:MAG TPA: HAMP domain-containing sensor histidine kinase [Oscillospiraceae bacterium]|nr:HAMP domain-containing sensor histidine kinase [Oscillospiraceae bacterium]